MTDLPPLPPHMTSEPSSSSIPQARTVVRTWLERSHPGLAVPDEELADRFCAQLPSDIDLELRTNYNPSALVYEARWYHGPRLVEEFPKPFCAESKVEARLLACAAMINLPD